MSDPNPGPDAEAPLPPEETESGRAKHVAPVEEADGAGSPAPAVPVTRSDEPAVAANAAAPAVAVPATGRDGSPDEARTQRLDMADADTPAERVEAADTEARTERLDADADRRDAARLEADADTRTERLDAGSDGRTGALDADSQARTERLDADAERRDAARLDADADARTEGLDTDTRTERLEADDASTREAATTPVPPPAAPPTPMPPAAAPPPPKQQNNRLVGTAWVLLASLVFEIVLILAFALLVLIAAGPAAVGQNVGQLFATPFAWLPVVLFFLFYELTVLIFNRAGRFLYVLASLIVGAVVWVLFALLYLAMQQGGIGNEQLLGRVLVEPQFIIVGLVAREVMLWTGLAIGARGKRVRRRNRAAREEYERTLAAQRDDRAPTRA